MSSQDDFELPSKLSQPSASKSKDTTDLEGGSQESLGTYYKRIGVFPDQKWQLPEYQSQLSCLPDTQFEPLQRYIEASRAALPRIEKKMESQQTPPTPHSPPAQPAPPPVPSTPKTPSTAEGAPPAPTSPLGKISNIYFSSFPLILLQVQLHGINLFLSIRHLPE